MPGDISGAAFWGALAGGDARRSVEIEGVGLNPTRIGAPRRARARRRRVDVRRSMQASRRRTDWHARVAHERMRSFEIAPGEVPAVIDEIPALAALAA